MRHSQPTRTYRPERRDSEGRFTERSRVVRRSPSRDWDYEEDDFRDDWDSGKEDYRSERPYAEEERDYGRKEQSNRGRYSRELELEETRPRRVYSSVSGRQGFAAPRAEARHNGQSSRAGSRATSSRSTSRPGRTRRTRRTRTSARGFASMPAAEVRRIAAMGGRTSHGGGRPATRKTRARKTSRSRA